MNRNETLRSKRKRLGQAVMLAGESALTAAFLLSSAALFAQAGSALQDISSRESLKQSITDEEIQRGWWFYDSAIMLKPDPLRTSVRFLQAGQL